jgi:Zn-dependent protease
MISRREQLELLKAWAAISIAFGLFIWRSTGDLLFSILVSALTVGVGFVLHEMAHRIAAHKFKKHAEFRADNNMLIVSIIMGLFLPIIFAAPGAVVISGYITKRESGIISAWGPLTNMFLALIFIPLIFVIPSIAYYGFMINALLFLFNLLPFGDFDGAKILAWSKPVYFSMVFAAVMLNLVNIIIPKLLA